MLKVNKKKIKIKTRELPERKGNIGEPTVRYWLGHLKKMNLIAINDFSYGNEMLWRRNDLFEQGSPKEDLVQQDGSPPKDILKLRILGLVAYFCLYMLESKSLEGAKKKVKEDFSFLPNPVKKESFLSE